MEEYKTSQPNRHGCRHAPPQVHTCRELWPFKERPWCDHCVAQENDSVPAEPGEHQVVLDAIDDHIRGGNNDPDD